MSLSQPLALLPPPLPSRAPLTPHVDALAVAPAWRRRGAGAALLAAAEQLAGRCVVGFSKCAKGEGVDGIHAAPVCSARDELCWDVM